MFNLYIIIMENLTYFNFIKNELIKSNNHLNMFLI
jgi:hypothetical protein